MNKIFQVLALLLVLTPALLEAESNLEYSESYEVELPLYDKETHLGDVKATVSHQKLISIEKDSLLEIIKSHLSESTVKQIQKLDQKIDPSRLPLPIHYYPSDLKLNLSVNLEQRSTDNLDMLEDFQKHYDKEAIMPASVAGAINYRLEQNWANREDNFNYFGGQFNSFLNVKTFVLENQTFYQSNNENKWFRGDTRLIKDFEKKQVRFQSGDIYPAVQGFMTPYPIGGLSISRNFTLNPYRLPYPTGEQNFSLNSRSFVKYFVNGALIRSEYLPAGNYTAKDIPLNNGLNTIVIEATDDLGQKRVFLFRSSSSINLLNKGESRFDISHGVPFMDSNFKRDYLEGEGKLTSGFYQYGLSSSFSASLYSQNQQNFSLFGGELIQATPIGNFSLGGANSIFPSQNGHAQSLSYQLISQGTHWPISQTLGLRYEHRSKDFKTSLADLSSVIQNNYAINYTIPLVDTLTASLGGNYGDVRDNSLHDRYGFNSTLNVRLFNHSNASVFVGRNRDENKIWNDIAYVFVTIAFAGSNDFVSAFYDQQQKSSKLTYIKDNQNRLYHPKSQANLENNNSQQAGEVDVQVPTPYGDFGARVYGAHLIENDTMAARASARMNSALIFAYDKGDLGIGLSRPITSSFVLFRPEDRLKDQKISLRSTSPFAEAESGPLRELTFNNLLAYQYREVQLDPSSMDEGRTLKQEKYVVYPTYRSGHLIKLEEKGAVILRGIIKKQDGTPWALQVGQLSGNKTFFTNREGEFFIEGVEPGHYELKLHGQDSSQSFSVPTNAAGIKDLGELTLEEEL